MTPLQSNIRSMQNTFFQTSSMCSIHLNQNAHDSASQVLRKVFTVFQLKIVRESCMHALNMFFREKKLAYFACISRLFAWIIKRNRIQNSTEPEIKPNDYTQTRERQQRMVATKWGLESGNLATKAAKPYALSHTTTTTNDTEIAIFFPAASRFYKFKSRQYVDTVYTRLNAMHV